MRVTEVLYGRLVSDLNYGNRRGEVRVEVGQDDDPAEALRYAKAFVHEQIGLPWGPVKVQHQGPPYTDGVDDDLSEPPWEDGQEPEDADDCGSPPMWTESDKASEGDVAKGVAVDG